MARAVVYSWLRTCIECGVRAWRLVHQAGFTEALRCLKHHVALDQHLFGQMVGGNDAGDAGTCDGLIAGREAMVNRDGILYRFPRQRDEEVSG